MKPNNFMVDFPVKTFEEILEETAQQDEDRHTKAEESKDD